MPLIGVPRILSPDLLKILAEMVRSTESTRLAMAPLRGKEGPGDVVWMQRNTLSAGSRSDAQDRAGFSDLVQNLRSCLCR